MPPEFVDYNLIVSCNSLHLVATGFKEALKILLCQICVFDIY
jgi:hypothetical protein